MKILTNPELANLILEVVHNLEAETGFMLAYISLGDPAFAGLPCSPVRLYRVARLHCKKWGYAYQPIDYKSSRAQYRRPSELVVDEDRWKFTKPALIKIKEQS